MTVNKIKSFIYLSVFITEFSFFFALPLLGNSLGVSANDVAACLAGSVMIENVLMITATGFLERYSRRSLISVSLLLRCLAFLTVIISTSLYYWLFFFFLISVSKSISKPFLREMLSDSVDTHLLKKALYTYSFCQNSAVFIAPTLAMLALKYNFTITVLLSLFFLGACLIFIAWKVIYNYPSCRKDDTRLPLITTSFRTVINSRSITRLLISSFFCFTIMGVFITATTLLGKINVDMGKYSGIFFSVVGISICIWQVVIARNINFSGKISLYLILLSGITSSLYLISTVYIAVIALIFYSIYESAIIPEIFYKAGKINTTVSTGVIFSYILVTSNLGEAFGSWLTGLAISHVNDHVPIFIFFLVFFSTLLSFSCLIKVNNKEDIQCQE